jgi:hypothetical protein
MSLLTFVENVNEKEQHEYHVTQDHNERELHDNHKKKEDKMTPQKKHLK